jgi:hypothetical protein
MEPITKTFLGNPDTWRDAKIEIDEIDAVWGGKCITVYGDGTAFVKIVDLSKSEETYRLQLGAGEAPNIFDALLKNDVLAGSGLEQDPDVEPNDLNHVLTRLIITNAAGEMRTFCHVEGGPPHPEFEAVRDAITYVYDHMAELGAALISAVPPAPAGELSADFGTSTGADATLHAHPDIEATPASLGEARSPLRALQGIAAFFTEDGWSYEQMPERPILRLPFQGKGGRWNCYAQVRVTRDVEQVLFYSVLPLNVPDSKLAAIAEFITRANYGMALGNFELDFNDGEVRYKTSVDVTETEITSDLLRPLVYTNVLMMDKYMSGLMAVVYADMSPAEAVKQIEG